MNIDELMRSARDAITVKRVFGDPIERDGVTVVPAAKVRGGAGGGSGKDEKGEEGGGGGFGIEARPAGVYVIKHGRVTWVPAVDPARVVATVGLVLLGVLVIRAKTAKAQGYAHGHHGLARAATKAALMRFMIRARATEHRRSTGASTPTRWAPPAKMLARGLRAGRLRAAA